MTGDVGGGGSEGGVFLFGVLVVFEEGTLFFFDFLGEEITGPDLLFVFLFFVFCFLFFVFCFLFFVLWVLVGKEGRGGKRKEKREKRKEERGKRKGEEKKSTN